MELTREAVMAMTMEECLAEAERLEREHPELCRALEPAAKALAESWTRMVDREILETILRDHQLKRRIRIPRT